MISFAPPDPGYRARHYLPITKRRNRMRHNDTRTVEHLLC